MRVGRVRRRARSSDTDINVVDPALVEAVEIYRGSPGPI
jgi:outer membrane receptor protein involved in Fe transport